MSLFKISMITVVLIILFFLLLSFWGFYVSIKPPKIISKITPKDYGLEYEEVTFKTQDDLKLKGWFIPAQKNWNQAKTIVLLHGYPADKGNILLPLSFLNESYNLFLFDFRSLGSSQGKYSTIGAKEQKDLKAALLYLKSRNINKVGVWGFSMGGAVALMTAPKAQEIKAVVSESSYSRLDLMAYELYRLPVLHYPLGFLTNFWAKAFLKIDAKKVAPAESAKKLDIPILIIHSKNDEVISFSHALKIKESLKQNKQAEYWFEENLIHGQLSKKYQKRIEDFFNSNLK